MRRSLIVVVGLSLLPFAAAAVIQAIRIGQLRQVPESGPVWIGSANHIPRQPFPGVSGNFLVIQNASGDCRGSQNREACLCLITTQRARNAGSIYYLSVASRDDSARMWVVPATDPTCQAAVKEQHEASHPKR